MFIEMNDIDKNRINTDTLINYRLDNHKIIIRANGAIYLEYHTVQQAQADLNRLDSLLMKPVDLVEQLDNKVEETKEQHRLKVKAQAFDLLKQSITINAVSDYFTKVESNGLMLSNDSNVLNIIKEARDL